MTSEEILEELVAQTAEIGEFFGLTFEALEDYRALADARLSAFSSENMWVVAIEMVSYEPGPADYSLDVFLLGNCVRERESIYLSNSRRVLLTTPNAWNKEIEKDQIWGIARDGFAFRWRGKRFDFAPSVEDLGAAGIELSRREIETGELSPQQMLRYVCEKLNHPFFLGEDALRDLLDQNAIPFEWKYDEATERSWYENELGEFDEEPLLSTILELILQTRDWIHPKLGLGDPERDEWEISPREAFATLAETLATRDLTVWNAQDASKFNSHWRHWAEIDAEKERTQLEKIAAGKAVFRAYIEALPRETRSARLEQFRLRLQTAPSISNWSHQMFIESDNQRIALFRELVEEVDAMQSELKLEQPENS